MGLKSCFVATHVISCDGERFPVMLIDGALYTREEADSLTATDWELDDDGELCFQGELSRATIRKIGPLDVLAACEGLLADLTSALSSVRAHLCEDGYEPHRDFVAAADAACEILIALQE